MSGPLIPSLPPSLRVPLSAVALGMVVMVSSLVVGQRGIAAAEREASRVREVRAELHSLQRARARLTAAAHVPAPDASLDPVRIAILDAVRELGAGGRVGVLRHRLLDGDDERGGEAEGDLRIVRLAIELRAAHAVRLVRALDALRAAAPAWPVEVAGCRVDRAVAGSERSDDPGAEEDHALVAACALDWFWWPA